jgi:pimeloyl-ACP methyl ester carboxylesterase
VSAPREITLDLPHIRLAARVWGDESLPPLLALHGWLDNAASLDRLAPLICTHFHIVALDFPGHGRSGWRPPGTWYHYIDYVSDVIAAAEKLGWHKFSLLGHSLGGTVASVFAACRPQSVDKLLLIEALGPIAAPGGESLDQLRRGMDQRATFEEKLRVFAREDEAIEIRSKVNGLSRDAATALVARGLKAVPGGFSWSSDPRLTLATPLRFTEDQMLAVLRGIEAPTLLVLAQPEAPYLPRETMRRRIEQVRNICVRRLDGSHHLHLENAAPVAKLIGDFVAKNR